ERERVSGQAAIGHPGQEWMRQDRCVNVANARPELAAEAFAHGSPPSAAARHYGSALAWPRRAAPAQAASGPGWPGHAEVAAGRWAHPGDKPTRRTARGVRLRHLVGKRQRYHLLDFANTNGASVRSFCQPDCAA